MEFLSMIPQFDLLVTFELKMVDNHGSTVYVITSWVYGDFYDKDWRNSAFGYIVKSCVLSLLCFCFCR